MKKYRRVGMYGLTPINRGDSKNRVRDSRGSKPTSVKMWGVEVSINKHKPILWVFRFKKDAEEDAHDWRMSQYGNDGIRAFPVTVSWDEKPRADKEGEARR